jgi:phenylacetate-CoA ligase
MASLQQQIYWRSPYFLKRWLASANARRQDRERYGPAYDRHVADAMEHGRWTAERHAEHQRKALRELISQAATRTPYYRRVFAEAGIDAGRIRTLEDLRRLPILEKQVVRSDPLSLVDETLDPRDLMKLHTSGTTGTPLELYRDAGVNAAAFAYLDARWHSVAGVCRRRDRSVSIGGHSVAEPGRNRPPFWVYNSHWRQLYVSSYHLSPRFLGAYVAALREFNGVYIEGYPSSVYAIARYIVEKDLPPVPFRACFTTAEALFDYQREAIRAAFGCRTYSQYGCGEMAVFAAECREGSMHLSPEFGIVEVVGEDGRQLPPGATGQFLCTGLINRVQFFIRYRLGDVGSLRPGHCRCGSSLPMLGHVEGRADAVLITRDGRRIGRLDPVFKDARHLVEAQIVQDDWDAVRVRIVPGEGYTESDGRQVAENLRQRLGSGTVRIEIVEHIKRTPAGKFQAVVCNLPTGGAG